MREYASCATGSPPPLALQILDVFRWRANEKAPRLDIESLALDLKRDLGLSDGRASPPRDPLRD